MALITEEEWKRLLPLLDTIKAERRETAYNRLVKGMTMAKAGEHYGYSRQDVNILCQRVLKRFGQLKAVGDPPAVPRGWVRIEVVVPKKHVDDVRRVVEAMYPPPEEPRSKAPGRAKRQPRAVRRSR